MTDTSVIKLVSIGMEVGTQSASRDPRCLLRLERLALAPSELAGVAETARARVGL